MKKGEGAPGDREKSGGRGERAGGQRRATPRGPALWLHLRGDMRVTVRTPLPRAPPRPAHPDSGPQPARRLWTYVIVAPLPEVEGPDGPEEQQHRPRNEDHSSDLEQPRGAGGLHGHRGVCLRAGGGEVGEGGPVTSAPPAPPHLPWRWQTARPLSPRSVPKVPCTQAWMCDQQTFARGGPGPRGCARSARHRTPAPASGPTLPFTAVWGPENPTHARGWAPASQIRWRESLTPGSGFGPPRKSRALRVHCPGSGTGNPEPYSPGDCKTRRRQAPPGRWELCRSFLSWLWPEERYPGSLRARPGLCPAAPTCWAFQRCAHTVPCPARASPAVPTPSRASPLSSLPSPAPAAV